MTGRLPGQQQGLSLPPPGGETEPLIRLAGAIVIEGPGEHM